MRAVLLETAFCILISQINKHFSLNRCINIALWGSVVERAHFFSMDSHSNVFSPVITLIYLQIFKHKKLTDIGYITL